jgi:hypothetical protein
MRRCDLTELIMQLTVLTDIMASTVVEVNVSMEYTASIFRILHFPNILE